MADHFVIRKFEADYEVDATRALNFIHQVWQKVLYGIAFALSLVWTGDKGVYGIVKKTEITRSPPIGELITRLTLVVTYLGFQAITVQAFTFVSQWFWTKFADILFSQGSVAHHKFDIFVQFCYVRVPAKILYYFLASLYNSY